MLNSVMCQIGGAEGERCGSFAKSGLPVTVSLPLTTQLLLASLSLAYRPRRASALTAAASLKESASSSFELADGFLGKTFEGGFLFAALFLLSLPTRMTSRGEVSGKSWSRNGCGKSVKAARVRSARHDVVRASSKILPIISESEAVQGRGLICR